LDFPSNYLSRKAEYAADSFSAQRSNRSHIMSALVRLAQENLSNLNPHPLYVLFHYNHPPLAARLNATKDLPPE
jgi:STE24 endopeptidase